MYERSANYAINCYKANDKIKYMQTYGVCHAWQPHQWCVCVFVMYMAPATFSAGGWQKVYRLTIITNKY